MKKLLGLVAFLLILYVLLLLADPGARSWDNHLNLGKRIGLFGILSLGAGCLIITGGIDLSVGSVAGLCATIFALLLKKHQWDPWAALGVTLACGALIGLWHGLLIAKLRIQAFVVTLCGLFIYRGAARWLAGDQVLGLGTLIPGWKDVLYKQSFFGMPKFLAIFLLLCGVFTVLLHLSVYGRYLYAIGSNELAARYSGVRTDRYKILAYVICSTLAAFFAVLFLMEQNSVQPSSTGAFYELYAIAGAVLGGCSLRGGEGTVLGIVLGTAILRLLPNLSTMWGVPPSLEYTVIGLALLAGALLDELSRRRALRK